MRNRGGQATIFIIMAVILLAAIAAFFVFRDSIVQSQIPSDMEPVYNSFISCLEDTTSAGIGILESQGGYITLPDFEPGSHYSPFSSQLDFFGNPIPYWYYVSGNNIQKEQVPTVSDMETQLSDYVSERVSRCRLDDYYAQGFEIHFDDPKATASISESQIKVSVSTNLNISRDDETIVVSRHSVTVNSNLGKLYASAKKVYDYEQKTLFLEQYAVDTLRLYAPVDGVEVTCSPLTWKADSIFSEVQDAVEANTEAIKSSSAEFTLQNKDNKYFVKDLGVSENVRFLNSKSWPYAFEINPTEGNLLVSRPIGNQEGLGVLGFCYVPYHYVYSLKYPVLAQVFDGNEIFQFPMAVVIEGNNPRQALNGTAIDFNLPQLCSQKNTEVTVNTYDTQLNTVDAEVSYECSGTKCDLGKSSSGKLTSDFPQCANGDVIASAPGYREKRYQFSTIQGGSVDVVLDRLYNSTINLKLDGSNYNGNAIVTFVSDQGETRTISYPEQKKVELGQGQYEVQVYIYKNSSFNIASTKTQQCIDVPQSGLGGFFGFTKENCYTIEFPSQVVSNALAGGGKQNYYILESQLSSGPGTMEINAKSLPSPTSINQLENNYVLFDERGLEINFR